MSEEKAAEATPEASKPRFGRGLSRQYSLYPSKPSVTTVKGLFVAAVDVVKFLYTNDFTRGIGRDIIFFGGSIVLIRMIITALQDETNPA